MGKVFEDYFKRTEFVEGLTPGMMRQFEKGKLYPFLADFAKEVNVPEGEPAPLFSISELGRTCSTSHWRNWRMINTPFVQRYQTYPLQMDALECVKTSPPLPRCLLDIVGKNYCPCCVDPFRLNHRLLCQSGSFCGECVYFSSQLGFRPASECASDSCETG